jgi:hypothetical protein
MSTSEDDRWQYGENRANDVDTMPVHERDAWRAGQPAVGWYPEVRDGAAKRVLFAGTDEGTEWIEIDRDATVPEGDWR